MRLVGWIHLKSVTPLKG